MRHIGRTHGVSVSWLSERFAEGDYSLDYCDTDDEVADIYTKAFTDALKWKHAHELAGVIDPADIKRVINEHRDRHVRLIEHATKGLGVASGDAQTDGTVANSAVNAAPCSTRGVAHFRRSWCLGSPIDENVPPPASNTVRR